MKCPHRNELIQLNGDDLPADRSESLFDHLENCEPCATVFEQLAESTNNLGEHLAGIPQKDIEQAREKIEKRPGIQEPVASTETDSRESPYALSPGQKLEKYEILSLLDSGGMGEVYEARHSLMGHRVAIKVIRGRHQDNPVAYQKFLTEMKTLVRVEHPNLVRALDGGHEDGCLFVVMELLDGESLHTLCVERKIGSLIEIIDAMLGLCRGLENLHSHQLLHRDIKPANIMRLTDGTIKVIDLGLAADNVAGRQMSHVGAGTQGYMPPEQTYGSDSLNERSDIFSAGRVLKDLLRALPGSGTNSNQAKAVTKLEVLADWMTKLEMEDRPQSVKEVLVELKKLRRAMGKSVRRRQTQSRRATAHPSATERKYGRIFATPGVWITFVALVMLVIVLANMAPESGPIADPMAGSAIPRDAPPTAIAPFNTAQARQHQQLWAEHLEAAVEVTNSIGMKFTLIPPGQFTMGIEADETETTGPHSGSAKPAHQVTISNSLYFGVHEVTRSQWSAVTDSNAPAEMNDPLPANGMNWIEATEFCQALSDLPAEKAAGRIYRLPTEAEWEYVCRAGTTGTFFWGDDPTSSRDFAWTAANSDRHTHPVGMKLSNPWGVFDMHGNLWEWCQDWYGPYPIQSPSGPRTGTLRVQRGGSFNSQVLRSTYRNMNPPDLHHNLHGLRIVLDIPLNGIGTDRALPPTTSEQPAGIETSKSRSELQNKIPSSDSSSALQTDQEAAAQRLGLPKSLSLEIDAGQTAPLEFVLIPAGEFQMGMPTELKLLPGETAASKPAHMVRISKPFYMSQFEVSEQQFLAVVGGGLTPLAGDGSQFPATQITWNSCVQFCTELAAKGQNIPEDAIVRLPTEAEWEYACRAGTTTRYWFGRNIEPHHASYRHRSMSLKPCDAFAPNPFGLYNVHGNVAEWCSDWFAPNYYDWFDPETPMEDPNGPETGTTKVIRGGGYSNPPFAVTSFWRQSYRPDTRSASIGVRPVIELIFP